ncbi:M3 family oligoendopeptidase [Cohnella lubricantis]|uniref:M3 family oligoendopeptidase n=1 Tax=Cohnella lubricantis TaxID=2163172 RepID=A0A841TIF4_9BACL|nr:M3 family oligoendopeptidase [Cohnella lubricantis]MBB6678261.1 M3 family oligoendopeptidase [Cohnella lubricantis]MBP2118462.1 pepF/M3 family oligoendopeptidase [Cohnella lubricantis]
MAEQLSQQWDLEAIFAGGSDSQAFAGFMAQTERLIAELLGELKLSGEGEPDEQSLNKWTAALQEARARIVQAGSFTGCLTAQDMHDKHAVSWTDKVQSAAAQLQQASDLFDVKLAAVPDERFKSWAASADRAGIAFPLSERREAIRDKLPPELEALASELAIDGYHGWGEHYQTIVGRIAIPWEEDGKSVTLSAGQAFNKLNNPKQEVRDEMGAKWEEAWGGQADLAADTLNRMAGFRLKLYGRRGWEDVLREPLKINRMSRETLDAMWDSAAGGMDALKRYFAAKARLLGKDKLGWHDVSAPVAADASTIPFDEAATMIEGAFNEFSPNLAALAKRAFQGSWIEAEDRAGKRPGGFCTDFPLNRETRIFMTYSGTADNVSTLAHELGHAYHSSLVSGLQPFAQDYAMNVAETASTFAEALVSDELLRRAGSDAAKLSLLDERLQSAVAFLMNIRARFLFETRFYERRGEGMLDVGELNELMVAAQREAFGDALGSWHPHFWASKLHFYITDVPFYNFPYTFGYLFSTGIGAVAAAEGKSFAGKYDALLRDTGLMTVEELASRHLGVDLRRPDFWQAAVKRAVSDIGQFEQLAASR